LPPACRQIIHLYFKSITHEKIAATC
jgi:hypothetical protein